MSNFWGPPHREFVYSPMLNLSDLFIVHTSDTANQSDLTRYGHYSGAALLIGRRRLIGTKQTIFLRSSARFYIISSSKLVFGWSVSMLLKD